MGASKKVSIGMLIKEEPDQLESHTGAALLNSDLGPAHERGQPGPHCAWSPDVFRNVWLRNAVILERAGKPSAALSRISLAVDDLMRNGQWSELDSVLTALNPKWVSKRILIGLLTMTVPGQENLPHRESFRDEVEKQLRDSNELEPGLLEHL